MPDQSSASREHALMQEITAPLATLPDDPVPVVADVEFPMTLRGYDRIAVDAYVKNTSQLVAELQATRSPDTAIRRALERVGEEVSGILQRAHETAAQITTQSRSEAEDRLEAARREAAEIVAGARRQVRELDAETDRIWSERHRIVEDARELSRQLVALADSAADRFPPAEESSGGVAGERMSEGQVEQEALESKTDENLLEDELLEDELLEDELLEDELPEDELLEAEGGQALPGGATTELDGARSESGPDDDEPDVESTAVIPPPGRRAGKQSR